MGSDGIKNMEGFTTLRVLTLETERLIPLFDLSERDGSDVASME